MGSSLHRPRSRQRPHTRAGVAISSTVRGGRPRSCGNADPELERARLSERARFAHKIDVELQVACRIEAASRHELGIVARDLLRGHAYRRLGFVRLSDYARERLGISARTVHAAAWVATRLDALPIVAAAFDRSELSWAQVRAVCAVAGSDDQEEWLLRARACTVEGLERTANASQRKDVGSHDPDHDDGTIDGEPSMQLRIACPARVRALWRRALELASRVAGEPLAPWRAAEVIAAEAFSGRPAGVSLVDRAVLACMRLARRVRRSNAANRIGGAVTDLDATALETGLTPDRCPDASTIVTASVTAAATASTAAATASATASAPAVREPARANQLARASEPARSRIEPSPAALDPFALDARLVDAIRAIRTSEPRIGRLLRIVVDQRVYRARGFTSFAGYVRERLGISVRKAWALLKVERSTRRDDDFASAYHAGTISWVQALTLLPVVDRANAAAWLARAESVTVRRLADEVNWVLEARDIYGTAVPLNPPALDSVLLSPVWQAAATAPVLQATTAAAIVQIGAHTPLETSTTKFDSDRRAASEVCDVEIQMTAPASVVALVREALDAFAEPGAPRWSALERVLRHVIGYWESTPRHRDPIFARDGWRCTVPGCGSRRNLHDHHLLYRSRGGGNERENRTAVCVAHHLHGIHAGTVRSWGTAPHDVHWQLGVRSGRPPLLSYVGDRRCPNEAAAI